MTDDTVVRPGLGAKSNSAFDLPFGVTGIPTPGMLGMLSTAAVELNMMHPGSRRTRAQASLFAGASLIASEPLMFGFGDTEIVDTPVGWATCTSYLDWIDCATQGHVFGEADLRLSISLKLCGSAALALFRDYDMLSDNIDMISIACMIQRRAEMIGYDFNSVLKDELSITARILQHDCSNIEKAAGIIEREGNVTRNTSGVAVLLAAASAVPIGEMSPAPEQARKLASLIGAARFDLETFAREFSRVARENWS